MLRGVSRRMLLGALLVLGLIAGGGVAYGYWAGSGSGTATGTTGTVVAVTLSPGAPGATLFPGGTSNVVLNASNGNTTAVHIGSLVLATAQGTGGFAVDAGHAGCAVATLSFTTQTNGGAGWTVPPKVGAVNGALSITLTNALAMGLGAANACQGATTTVYLAATP